MPLASLHSIALNTRVQAVFAVVFLTTAFGSSRTHATDQVPPVEPPWQDVLTTNYTLASDKLEKLYEADPRNARYAVAYAASLLSRDPTTRANVRKAHSILIKKVSDLPVSETEHRPLALYLLARIEHDHVEPVRFDTARGFYEQLRKEYPDHPLADQAAVQMLLLMRLSLPEERWGEVAAKLEETIPTVRTDSARRQLHAMGVNLYEEKAILDDAGVLRHLLAGRQVRTASLYGDAQVDLHIAGLARKLGMKELAAKHYLAFAEALPRDTRAYTARRFAKELGAEGTTASQPNTQ